MKKIIYGLGPLLGGLMFALGLGISGMTESKNIIGFLDLFGDWQGELLFVMGGAILVYGTLFQIIIRNSKPLFESSFSIPQKTGIDKRLILGALLFGMGWGITGLCPGPGLIALISGKAHAIVFVSTMLVGMLIGRSNFGEQLFSGDKNK